MKPRITNQRQLRREFWQTCFRQAAWDKARRKLPDGSYTTDTRCAFVEFIDTLSKDGDISQELAQRATL